MVFEDCESVFCCQSPLYPFGLKKFKEFNNNTSSAEILQSSKTKECFVFTITSNNKTGNVNKWLKKDWPTLTIWQTIYTCSLFRSFAPRSWGQKWKKKNTINWFKRKQINSYLIIVLVFAWYLHEVNWLLAFFDVVLNIRHLCKTVLESVECCLLSGTLQSSRILQRDWWFCFFFSGIMLSRHLGR